MTPPPPLAPRRRRGVGALFFVALALLLTVGPAAIIVPLFAPQPTCDALAPLVRCSDGSVPECSTVPTRVGRRQKQAFSLSVNCPDGTGSSAPVYAVSFGILGATLLFFFGVIVLSVRRRRREA
ncbi:MAG: hypothetical protein U0414_27660 [Polyangiaceae bacterium]